MYRHICLFISIFSYLILYGSIQPVKATDRIRIGFFQNEPIVYKDRKGKPDGLYIDLITKIADHEHWNVKFVFGTWSQCLKRLKNNDIDLMTSIAPSSERKKELVFSKENILTMWGQVYVKKKMEIENILDLDGQNAVILKDDINGINFEKRIDAFDINCHIVKVDSYEDAAQYVVDGLATACVINNIHGRMLKRKFNLSDTPIMFNPYKLVFATSKLSGKTDLLDTIDHHIKEWKKNDQSHYSQRVRHWYGEREPAERVIPQWVFIFLFFSLVLIITLFAWINSLSVQIKKRKQAQNDLADSQKRLSDIIEFLPDPTWVIDLKGRVIAWNKAIEEMTGIPKDDILGKGNYAYSIPFYGLRRPVLIDLVLKRDKTWEKKYLELKENKNTLVTSISYHPMMKGEKKYLYGKAGKLFDATGQTVGAIETIRDITEEKKSEMAREQLVNDLKNALDEIKTLSGLLPICASCKKIRDDKGYWNQIEVYIQQHSEAEFSHGICPDCMDALYGDKDWYIEMKKKRASK